MATTEAVAFVFLAGLLTDAAAGLGVVPFVFLKETNQRSYVILWGIASGIMLSTSVFGLLPEGSATGTLPEVASGVLVGALLVFATGRVLAAYEFHPQTISEADFRRLLLIVGTLTVHSVPEGVAIGVSFVDLGVGTGGASVLGMAVPVLAVFVTVAIAVQNVPEGLAVAIPLKTQGLSNWQLLFWAVVSSAPQPFAAVVAFYFVRIARQTLAFGFGFAAGAMLFLVVYELLPEAHDQGSELPNHGRYEIALGLASGTLLMTMFLVYIG